MMDYARIAARLFNTPLMIAPDTAAVVLGALADRFSFDAEALPVEASRFRGAPTRDPQTGEPSRMYRVENGVAIVSLMGELVNRGAWIGASSGLTSYEGFEAQLRAAAADISVRGIVLDINSPGGEAAGAMEAAAIVRSVAKSKPVVAFVNGMAASAAYAIASGASRIVAAPSAVLGSIGVVMIHFDRSEQMSRSGVKPTILQKGAYKTDFTSLKPLDAAVTARVEAFMGEVYDLFVGTVAQNRNLTAEAVRGTEAAIYLGQGAVAAGLADAIGSFDDALALVDQLSTPTPNRPTGGLMSAETSTTYTQAQFDQAVSAARTESAAAARTSERARISAILDHQEAQGRTALARQLAFSTDMTAEAAAPILSAAAKDAPAAAAPAPAPTGLLAQVAPRPAVQPDQPSAAAPANEFERGMAIFGAVVPAHQRRPSA